MLLSHDMIRMEILHVWNTEGLIKSEALMIIRQLSTMDSCPHRYFDEKSINRTFSNPKEFYYVKAMSQRHTDLWL